MSGLAFDIPEGTLRSMRELAAITGIKDDNQLAKLILDALRTYEWIVFQQASGRIVTALGEPEVQLLERAEDVDADREYLNSFVQPDQQKRALDYFATAAS